MDIIDAVRQRKSIRAFKPDAVPQEIIREIIGLALRAPSWANTQPCEFTVVGGSKLEEIRQAIVTKAEERPNPDLAVPAGYPEPFDTRRRNLAMKVAETKGIDRDDVEKRMWWRLEGLLSFQAPSAIYICIDRSFYLQGYNLNIWPIFDCGSVVQTIMLLATGYGLGTVPQIQAVHHPDVLRKILKIPDSKIIVLGIAIGYPDWNDPVNQFNSEREPLGRVARCYGFG